MLHPARAAAVLRPAALPSVSKMLPHFWARLRPSAVRVRLRSPSRSAKPPSTGNHQSPGVGFGIRPTARPVNGIALWRRRSASNGEQVNGAECEAVNARHYHHIAGGEGV